MTPRSIVSDRRVDVSGTQPFKMSDPTPPPGYYSNPQGGNGYAYWDGARWHLEMRRRMVPWWLVMVLSPLSVRWADRT